MLCVCPMVCCLTVWGPCDINVISQWWQHSVRCLWHHYDTSMTSRVDWETCDSSNIHNVSTMLPYSRDQTASTITQFPTQSHYCDIERTSPSTILLMPSTKLVTDKLLINTLVVGLEPVWRDNIDPIIVCLLLLFLYVIVWFGRDSNSLDKVFTCSTVRVKRKPI